MEDYGLVFSGGGARGSYEIGVWESLNDLNIYPTAVVGTSIGAINGAFYAQQTLETAKKIWENLDINQILKRQSNNLLLSVDPLKKLLKRYIDEEKIRNSSIRFGLATYNLTTLKTEYRFIEDIPKGYLIDFILASANVPFFKREVINGQLYLDGGVTDTLPWKMLTSSGYKKIITVMVDVLSNLKRSKPMDPEITHYEIIHSDHLGGFLLIDHAVFKTNFDMGYYDTKKVFGIYTGSYYYLETKNSDTYSKKDIPILMKNTAAATILKNTFILRRLFIHLIISRFWVDHSITWPNLFKSCCELTADLFSIPRYEGLKIQDLIEKILKASYFIENSKEFKEYCREPLHVNAYVNPQSLINKTYYVVAMAKDIPLFKGAIHGASLIAPDSMIALIFLLLIKNRN